MRPGRRLLIEPYSDFEICTINNEDYVRLTDVPEIAKLLYGQRLVEFAKVAVDNVVLHYNKEKDTLEIVEAEEND